MRHQNIQEFRILEKEKIVLKVQSSKLQKEEEGLKKNLF